MSRSDRPFHELLREFREQRRMSPRDAARRAGVSVERRVRVLAGALEVHREGRKRRKRGMLGRHRRRRHLGERLGQVVHERAARAEHLVKREAGRQRAPPLVVSPHVEELAGAAGVPAVDLPAARAMGLRVIACDIEEWCCRVAVSRLRAAPAPEPPEQLGPLFGRGGP